MDAIQKTLIEEGRKDLAQKYYKKITAKTDAKQFIKKNMKTHVKDQDFRLLLEEIIFDKATDWAKAERAYNWYVLHK